MTKGKNTTSLAGWDLLHPTPEEAPPTPGRELKEKVLMCHNVS